MEDQQILELYRLRSEDAIRETAAKYGAYCRAVAMNILQNPQDAEECVNETFLNAWNAIPPEQPSVLCAFLGKITRNLSLNRLKRSRAQKRGGGTMDLLFEELEECLPAEADVQAELDKAALTAAINAFLWGLEEQQRMMFVRRYWYADSIREIALRFGMSESKVKSLLFRIRGRLRVHLDEEDL